MKQLGQCMSETLSPSDGSPRVIAVSGTDLHSCAKFQPNPSSSFGDRQTNSKPLSFTVVQLQCGTAYFTASVDAKIKTCTHALKTNFEAMI